jgi:hypothetical protein
VGRIVHEPDEAAATSDCRQIEFGKEGEMVVQVCEPGDQGGFGGGYYCEVYPADQAPDMLAAYGLGEVEMAADERLEVCWPNYYGPAQITRSLVIGDTLWTLSWMGLQGNDLDGFEVTGKVRLG